MLKITNILPKLYWIYLHFTSTSSGPIVGHCLLALLCLRIFCRRIGQVGQMGGQVYTKPLTGKAIRLFFEIFVSTNYKNWKDYASIWYTWDLFRQKKNNYKGTYNMHITGYSQYYLSAKKRVICLQCQANNELGKKEPLSWRMLKDCDK